ncbi:MAG: tail fiber domain-containing protein [Bacteroidales bacterium]
MIITLQLAGQHFSLINGDDNTAIGRSALYCNTSGNQNTAVGRNALVDNTNGSNNIGIGFDAQVPSSTLDHKVRIGNTSIFYAGIQVGWSITSDEIWKEQIRELPYGIDMLMQLKPVDYYRKNNERKTREMGFIAQDVEILLNEMGYDSNGVFLQNAIMVT